MSACLNSSAGREVSPDTSTGVNWEGWGTSLAWFAHGLGQDPSTRTTVAQLLFSKNHGLGMNIVRCDGCLLLSIQAGSTSPERSCTVAVQHCTVTRFPTQPLCDCVHTRYNIGGANQEQVEDYRPGGAIPCFAKPDGGYDW